MGVLAIGVACIDTTIEIDQPLMENRKYSCTGTTLSAAARLLMRPVYARFGRLMLICSAGLELMKMAGILKQLQNNPN